MAYVALLLTCMVPLVMHFEYDERLDTKAQNRRSFAAILSVVGVGCLWAIGAGFYATGVIGAPMRYRLIYLAVMGTVWVACVVKNYRIYRGLFGDKPKGPDDELA